MTVKEISGFLENLFPLQQQEDYDNCGLLTGSYNSEVTGILLAVDVTPEILKEAHDSGCNLIIAHHPYIFHGLKKIISDDEQGEMIVFAIKNDISIYAIHTNLDNSLNGLNKFLGSALGLKNISLLSPKAGILMKLVTFCPDDKAESLRKALFEAGAGHIGDYDMCSYNSTGEGTFRANENADPFVGEINEYHFEKETKIEVIFPAWLKNRIVKAMISAHPYEEPAFDLHNLANEYPDAGSGITGETEPPEDERSFLEKVKSTVSIPVIRHSELRGKEIKKVAICTGSGAFMIRNAYLAGADILLTSDLKYHDFFDFRGKMILADIGHYESEQFAKELLYGILIKKFPNFAIFVSKTVTNPVNYF